jgi:hypothetical protein
VATEIFVQEAGPSFVGDRRGQAARGRLGNGRADRLIGGRVMGRRDFLDDPNAPANRLVPAASAIVLDEAGRILLHNCP